MKCFALLLLHFMKLIQGEALQSEIFQFPSNTYPFKQTDLRRRVYDAFQGNNDNTKDYKANKINHEKEDVLVTTEANSQESATLVNEFSMLDDSTISNDIPKSNLYIHYDEDALENERKAAKTTKENLRTFEGIDINGDDYIDDIAQFRALPVLVNDLDYEEVQALRRDKSLIGTFPFNQNVEQHHRNHHQHHGHNHEHDNEDINVRGTDLSEDQINSLERLNLIPEILSNLNQTVNGRKCIEKVMLTEETEYTDVLTCDHSYDKRCHTSYVTKYEPHQEEDCDEQFKKECYIQYEQKAIQELVTACKASMVKDCNIEGEEECTTVYESECWTQQKVHQVNDDVPTCNTIQETKCKNVTVGYVVKEECDVWPREVCTVETKSVQKYTPETVCEKVPSRLCAPKGCGLKEGPLECHEKLKTVIIDNPIEDCSMQPINTCKFVTKLVPKLEPTKECVDVPKEVCSRSKIEPKKVMRPSIQKWCYTPENVPPPVITTTEDPRCTNATECPPGRMCTIEGLCKSNPGLVLIKSIKLEITDCVGCSINNEGVTLKLHGQRTKSYATGIPCITKRLNKPGTKDFGTNTFTVFDGLVGGIPNTAAEEMMGTCFEGPLNGQLTDGGALTWEGSGTLHPSGVCVSWQNDDSYPWHCVVTKQAENVFKLGSCKSVDVC